MENSKNKGLVLLREGAASSSRFSDLSKPEDCRYFLSQITIDGQQLMEVRSPSNKRILIQDLSDQEILEVAAQMYYEHFAPEVRSKSKYLEIQ